MTKQTITSSAFLHFFVWAIALPSIAFSQAPLASIRGADWGISDPSEIRLAQFSLVHAPHGPLFNVQAIYTTGHFLKADHRSDRPDCLRIADFDDPFINLLGGSYHAFESGSSKAVLAHNLIEATGDQVLQLAFAKRADEYCGFWMHTFNSAAPIEERQYLDVTPFSTMMITIRGMTGGERLMLKAADDVWNAKEDALPVGDVGGYLPRGRIDTSWQTAVIPLDVFPHRLNISRLATIAFEVIGSDSGAIEFSSITFCANTQPPPEFEALPKQVAEPERALWVWNTRDLFFIQGELTKLQSVVRDLKVDHVFLALPYDPEHPEARNGVPIHRDPMARLVRVLKASGLKVHALMGDKDFIKPEHRGFVRTTIQNLLQYQQSVEPEEQFHGVHLDIEPYLLPGYGSARQSWFLENLLEVFAECARQAKSAGLVIGADIPAWLDAPNELTNQRAELALNGATKPVFQHIIDIMDLVALMDYRTEATGEAGFILQAANELRYAAEIRKKVFVGLETIALLDETLFVVRGEPRRGVPTGEGTKLCMLAANGRITAALVNDQSTAPDLLNNADPRSLWWWPVSRETKVPASRLTFAGNEGSEKLNRALRDSEGLLRMFASFAGFAFHDYEGVKRLTGK